MDKHKPYVKIHTRFNHMNVKTKLLSISALALVATIVPAGAFAQTDPAASPAGGTFDQRLVQRKNERKIALEEKDSKRIISQCTKAQTELRKVQTELRQLSSRRTDTYRTIDGKLWVAVGILKLGGKDTFKLERQRAAYIQNVEGFHTILKEYQQAIDDTVVVNCAADPIGFKALLETSRIYQAQLIAQSASIRNLVINDIKTTLSDHTTDLQPVSAGEM